jgi:hypothetical protein
MKNPSSFVGHYQGDLRWRGRSEKLVVRESGSYEVSEGWIVLCGEMRDSRGDERFAS